MRKILLFALLIPVIVSSCSKLPVDKPDRAIALAADTLTLVTGSSASITSGNYSAADLLWSSADATIVSVSSGGLITALKPGQTTITVSNKKSTVSATCIVNVFALNQIWGKGTDIGVGADSSIFVVGADIVASTGGHSIYKVVNNALKKLPDCGGAVRVAVSPQGVPWVVNKLNAIYKYNGTSWDQMPGTATDIAIGANGSIFAIGTVRTVSPTGGYYILQWNGTGWDTLFDCSGVHIAVSPQGIPWVVNLGNMVYQKETTGVLWDLMPGVSGNDIGIGADGSVFVTGQDYNTPGYLPPIFKFVNNNWVPLDNVSGTSIAVSPKGVPFWIDKSNNIFKLR